MINTFRQSPTSARFTRLLLAVTVFAIVPLGAARIAPGQEEAASTATYEVLELKEEHRRNSDVFKIIRGQMPLEGKQAALEAYFNEFVFAQMTQIDSENLSDLPKQRQSFFNRYLRAAKDSPEVLDFLNKLTLNTMIRLMAGNYHPAVRYNAALIVGDLDAKIAIEVGPEKVPPRPMPEALTVLIKAYRSSRLPDYVKAGALVGIVRHAVYSHVGMSAEERASLTEVMLEIIGEKNPPEGREPLAHAWLRRQAVEAVGHLRQPVNNTTVQTALVGVIGEQDAPYSLRCAAAEALGLQQKESGAAVDVEQAATQLGTLTLDLCASERQLVVEHGQLASRRLLLHAMTKIRTGLETPLANAAGKKVVTDVAKQVDYVLDLVKEDVGSESALESELRKVCQTLRVALGIEKDGATPTSGTDAATGLPTTSAAPKSAPKSDLEALEDLK